MHKLRLTTSPGKEAQAARQESLAVSTRSQRWRSCGGQKTGRGPKRRFFIRARRTTPTWWNPPRWCYYLRRRTESVSIYTRNYETITVGSRLQTETATRVRRKEDFSCTCTLFRTIYSSNHGLTVLIYKSVHIHRAGAVHKATHHITIMFM